jgi:GH24 family phage-related lysozyme (muramidase)
MKLDKNGIDFITAWETGGKAYYEKHYKSTFVWPGEASGPTIGVGIDCAYYTKDELKEMLKPYVSEEEMILILGAIGKTGSSGQTYTRKLKGIIITWEEALEIFERFTLPKFLALTKQVFPGVENLKSSAITALVSLVFNRGGSLKGDRRIEMRAVRNLIPTKNYSAIAAEFRKMKRYWTDTKSDSDLVDRREAEAKLIEQ